MYVLHSTYNSQQKAVIFESGIIRDFFFSFFGLSGNTRTLRPHLHVQRAALNPLITNMNHCVQHCQQRTKCANMFLSHSE